MSQFAEQELRNEVRTLVLRTIDGSALDSDAVRLETLLQASSQAARWYLEEFDLAGNLLWDSREAAHHELVEPLVEQSTTVTLPEPSHASIARRRWWPMLASVAAVAVLLYGGFVFLAWDLRSGKQRMVVASDDAIVAVASATRNVQWSNRSVEADAASSILAGNAMQIEAGTITLNLKRGVTLTIEGPAKWSIDSDNSATLEAGRLVAEVPKRAIGFTVFTPSAQIVDLGTEFTVDVDGQGGTEVEVLRGQIELQAGAQAKRSTSTQQAFTLSKGSAVRIESVPGGNAVQIRSIAAKSNSLPKHASTAKARRLFVSGAQASTEYRTSVAKCLIDGSGLRGERHSSDPTESMWLSGLERCQNEFVLFDLNRPCRLESMKVWNYNETELYISRGIKQADIYVSTSGRGNPLSDPDAWTLVVADQKFSPADGTPDYHTPDVISLNNAVARYVAIVVGDRLGPDPRSGLDEVCVGLSEVQIFGEPVVPPKPKRSNP